MVSAHAPFALRDIRFPEGTIDLFPGANQVRTAANASYVVCGPLPRSDSCFVRLLACTHKPLFM